VQRPRAADHHAQRRAVRGDAGLDDFKALEETAYLLRSPANARRLLAAMHDLEAGKGKVRKLAR